MTVSLAKKSVSLGLRVAPEVKALLQQLADRVSAASGVRVSMTQAFELAVREALAARGGENEKGRNGA